MHAGHSEWHKGLTPPMILFGVPADSIATAFRFFAERTGGLNVPEWVPTPSNVAYATAVEQLDSVVYSIIRERRRQLAGGRSPEQACGLSPPHTPPSLSALQRGCS